MYHSPKWFHLTKNLESSLLAEEESKLLSLQTKTKDIDSLSAMVSLQDISSNVCMFRSGLQMLRWIILIPWFICLCLSAIYFFSDFKNDWNKCEKRIIYMIENFDASIDTNSDVVDFFKKQNKYIGNDKVLSLNEYLYYRYN